MREQEAFADNLKAQISEFESSENPQARFMAELLREIRSDSYKIVLIKGADEFSECGRMKALRIVAEQDGVIKNFALYDGSLGKESKRQMSKAIREETKKIDGDIDGDPINLENLAIKTLRHVSLQTIAAISINENIKTREDVVQIRFPTVFMNLNPNIPPSQRDYFGLAVAAYFLKRVIPTFPHRKKSILDLLWQHIFEKSSY